MKAELNMIYGYIRVSSDKQTLENQKFEIRKFALRNSIHIDRWVEETISTRKPLEKRKLSRLLNILTANDILITSEISRLGRSLLEVMGILQNCLLKGCQIWTIKENYRLGADLQSKVMAFAFGLSAEIERQLISDRTRSSLENLKAKGIKLGRPVGANGAVLKLPESLEKIYLLIKNGCSQAEVSRIMGVHKSTICRLVKKNYPELMEEEEDLLFTLESPLAVSSDIMLDSSYPSRANEN